MAAQKILKRLAKYRAKDHEAGTKEKRNKSSSTEKNHWNCMAHEDIGCTL